MASDDEDVPETGAVFTFGKTRFADNLASKFWIRDDPVVQISCGDEHSAIVTAKGKLYTFGSNDWGQLGHGNTKPYNKPSVVKKLKPEKVYLVACGRNHTLVATESGKLYSFGCGSDGQLGLGDSEGSHEPKAIESFDETKFKKLACGSDFSAAVTESGILYTWGGGGDGQNGLGEDAEAPQRLYISGKVVTVGCGYYHMAVVTDDGSLYTCGESTGGKLGLEQSRLDETSQLQKVESIKEKVTTVSCGAEYTVAVTENGHVYSFGEGNQGQLGLGSLKFETEQPEKVQAFNKIKAKSVSCGESFTAVVTKNGNLYTFGDGRHGKLGLGDECFSNLFKPAKVSRFDKFVVNTVSCGGCHMLVTAIRKDGSIEDSDSEDQVEKEQSKTVKQGLMLDAVDGPRDLSATWSARDKRRQKNIEDINRNLSTTVPPIHVNKSSLPPLNGTLKRTLQNLKTTNPDKEDNKTTTNPLNMSRLPKITYPDDEDQKKVTNSPKPLPRGLPKPSPVAPPRALPRVQKQKEQSEEEEESEDEDDDDETENEKNRKNKSIKEVKKDVKKQEDEDEEDEDDETESEEETNTREASKDKKIIKPLRKAEDEEDEEESESEEETNAKDALKDKKTVKSIAKTADESEEDEEDEESEEETNAKDTSKDKKTVKSIAKTAAQSEDDEDEEEDEEEQDENQNKTKKGKNKKAKEKESKDKKIEEVSSQKKKSKKGEDEEDEEEDEDEDDGEKITKEDEKDKKNKKNKKKNKNDETEDNNKDAEAKENDKSKKGKKKKGDTDEDDQDKENNDDKKDDEKDEHEETNGENKEGENKDTNKSATETNAKKDKKSGICVIL